jgi:hypothetical protein
LGILFVWLFFEKYLGISVTLFIIAFYLLLFTYTKPVLKKEAKFGWFLSIPVLLLSLTFFFFRNETLMVLNVLAIPPIILLQTMLITGVNCYKWFSPGILLDMFMSMFARCLMHITQAVQDDFFHGPEQQRRQQKKHSWFKSADRTCHIRADPAGAASAFVLGRYGLWEDCRKAPGLS